MHHCLTQENERGLSLIEIIISAGIFLILSLVIITLISTSYRILTFTRTRTTAKHLGQEKIELIHNLPYENIGTDGGIPQGNIEQYESVSRNGLIYTVFTTITYIDDPFDGMSPADTLPNDYKRIRIDVSWEGISASQGAPVTIVTDISPDGTETTEGGGTLSILVFDSQGLPVPQADIHITATSTTPQVNLDITSNDNGIVVLPGSPVCVECYEITVTKEGFSTDKTYSVSEVANPAKPFASVLEGELTEISFAIDRVSELTINTYNSRSQGFGILPNTTFRLRGGKQIGTDVADFPVYKYDQELTTNGSGSLLLPDFEWDVYELYFSDLDTTYDIAGTNPINTFTLSPDTQEVFDTTLAAHSDHSLLVVVDDGGTPIEGAVVTLELSSTEIGTITTGALDDPDFGQAFFDDLTSDTYDITVTADGYNDFTGTVDVNERTLETISMNSI